MRSGWTLGRRGAVALLTVVVALVGGAAAPAGAQSSSQLAKEIDQVQNEIDRLDAEVGQLQDELTQVQADIQQANVRIAELEQQLGTVQSEVSDLAVSTFVSGDQIGGLGSLLTGSGDVTDSVEREQYAKLALSAQYISFPEFPWMRLRKETPEKNESYVDLEPDAWTKVKIEVQGDQARLFVHGSAQPTLIVKDLKHG